MNFNLTEKQMQFRDDVRQFVAAKVQPIVAQIDEKERFPSETIKKMSRLGWMGLPYPAQYGGLGLDNISYILAIEEISKACASTGDILSTHISLASSPIFKYGTEEQKGRYLVPMCKGKRLGAFALTESEAGSDVAAIMTTAKMEDGHYVLNGSKMFITNGGEAGTYIVFAKTDMRKGSKGISAFVVEKTYTGFTAGEPMKKMGIRASVTTRLHFENCVVPKENLLGREGDGFVIAMETLSRGRIGIAAQAVGIAQGAFEYATAYMKERKQFGKPLSGFQGLAWMMADIGVRIDAARMLVYRAAFLMQEGKPFVREASAAKLYASETAVEVTRTAVQILGGRGYLRDCPLERMMRDAKITEIYEGTSQVQKMIIAKDIFK